MKLKIVSEHSYLILKIADIVGNYNVILEYLNLGLIMYCLHHDYTYFVTSKLAVDKSEKKSECSKNHFGATDSRC